MDSTSGFWRVYRDEWTVTHVSDADGEDGKRECMQRFVDGYQGRVRAGEWRIVSWSESDPGGWPWMLEVHLPVMKGEWCDRQDARIHAAEIGGSVVREDSREELEMLRRGAEMTRKSSG
jgi:hypothetical protein